MTDTSLATPKLAPSVGIIGPTKSKLVSGRTASLDYLRFLGAVGIVLFHMALPGAWFALAALPMFVTLIVAFGIEKPLVHHIKRLLLPWIAWSVIYAAFKLAQATLEGRAISEEFHLWMLLAGGAIHLWFLPFCVLFFAFFECMKRLLAPGFWLPVALSLSIVSLWASNSFMLPIPFAQWSSVIPAAFLGLALASSKTPQEPLIFSIFGLSLFIAIGWDENTWQLLVATCVISVGFLLRLENSVASEWCAMIAFGIYLIHPAILAALNYATAIDGWVALVIAISVSSVLVSYLRKTAPWLV